MNGYDIDGVLTAGIIPVDPFIVVTGRPVTRFKETKDWLDKKFPSYIALYIRPTLADNDVKKAGLWKASVIQQANLQNFYEDEELQFNTIKEYLSYFPELPCKLHRVINGKVQ